MNADTTSTVRVNGFEVELECVVSSSIDDASRPLAMCVHGFPDTPHTWRYLTAALDHAGWRVVAPFLRGYAPSAIPADSCLQTGASSMDLIALHDHFGGDSRAVVIGHDWGAPIAYGAAVHAPDRFARVVGLAVPPGPAVGAALLTNPTQLKRSWYMFFFQHPLADLVVPADDLAFIDMIWSDWSPNYDGAGDVELVKDALRDPDHLAAAIGYYRAALGGVGLRDDLAGIQEATATAPTQPTLYLHGVDDGCVGVEVAEAARAMVGPDTAIELIEGAAHFLHLEVPDMVNHRILEFLS